MGEHLATSSQEQVHDEKTPTETQHLEKSITAENFVYNDAEEEPELHMRTWLALASMFLLNMVQVFALQGPPAVVCTSICCVTQLIEAALLHWGQPRQSASTDLGSQLALPRTSGRLPAHLVCIRYLPSS